jgi:hypothetical protein
MTTRVFFFAVVVTISAVAAVWADDNVREVQEQLRDGGFYSGDIDGAYSSQLAEALTRYQTSNRLPVSGQLDVDTSNALGAKPAVTKNKAAPERTSETSRPWRNRDQQTLTNARERSSARTDRSDMQVGPAQSSQGATDRSEREIGPAQSGPIATPVMPEPATQSVDSSSVAAPIPARSAKPGSALPTTAANASTDDEISTERLRDYVGAFVHAGLDPQVGSEADFFADRVKYYDQGVIDRERIRNDLQNYAARWPERHFSFAGNITIEPQHRKRVRVTFPLRYELRNGATYSSGTIDKTLVLEPAGDHLQIVAVSERKAE